jgi:hypothetical protein
MGLEGVLGVYGEILVSQKSKLVNFNHIVRNLLGVLQFAERNKEIDEHSKYIYDTDLNYLQKYLSLLDEFPEFREQELNKLTEDSINIHGYIKCQYERLKGKF